MSELEKTATLGDYNWLHTHSDAISILIGFLKQGIILDQLEAFNGAYTTYTESIKKCVDDAAMISIFIKDTDGDCLEEYMLLESER